MSPVRETHQSLGKVTYMRFKTSSYCLGGFGSGHEGIKEDRSHYLVATRGVLMQIRLNRKMYPHTMRYPDMDELGFG